MKKQIFTTAAAISALLVATVAAAGTTPIRTETDALRSALSGYITAVSAPGYMDQITLHARFFVRDGLERLAAVTTPAAMAATPAGIEIPCAASGVLRARLAPTWPRTVRFEWVDCASNPSAPLAKTSGPAEVVLVGNSFAAQNALSLRVGDRTRDLRTSYQFEYGVSAA